MEGRTDGVQDVVNPINALDYLDYYAAMPFPTINYNYLSSPLLCLSFKVALQVPGGGRTRGKGRGRRGDLLWRERGREFCFTVELTFPINSAGSSVFNRGASRFIKGRRKLLTSLITMDFQFVCYRLMV